MTVTAATPRINAAPAPGFGQDAWKLDLVQPKAAQPAYERDAWVPAGGAAPAGPDTRRLQQALKAAGFDPGPIDGDFGDKTGRAVRRFQRAHGLRVDGVAGPKTLAALGLAGGVTPASVEAPAPKAKAKAPTGRMKDYHDLVRWAQARGFHVTSTNGGKHNKGSSHYQGRAIDIRTKDHSKAQVDALIREARAAGIKVLDERRHPRGQAVWSGPHVHLEIPRR